VIETDTLLVKCPLCGGWPWPHACRNRTCRSEKYGSNVHNATIKRPAGCRGREAASASQSAAHREMR
jgi:hypothetical protein